MTELKNAVVRFVSIPGLGPMVVTIDRSGVSMRRPKERGTSAFHLPWFSVHGQAARLRVKQDQLERAKKRADRRTLRGGR
jgi:hypothetical protein